MSVPDYTNLSNSFFSRNSSNFDLSTGEGCGQYTEAFVEYARKIDSKIGHLRKNPGQTQYNGHANDAVLYPVGDGIYHAVDIIGRAEQPKPWFPESDRQPPMGQWSEDKDTVYGSKDWTAEPIKVEAPKPVSNFPSYSSLGDDAFFREHIGKALDADYKEAKQSLNDGAFVWAAQTIWEAIFNVVELGMTPEPAMQKSLNKHRPEWRAALGI